MPATSGYGGAMTAVYVLTAGSGDTYRIERVYLDSDEAHRFAQDYNGIARRELAGVPRLEVVGPSKEKVEELFWDTITQVRADLAGVPRKQVPLFRVADGTKRVYRSTLPLLSVMMTVWIDAPWNGSATTS